MFPTHDSKGERPIVALVVDDSPVDRALVQTVLENQLRAIVHVAENGEVALGLLEAVSPDFVVTDLQMPELDGLALVEAIRLNYPFVPTILMTAHGSEEIAFAALRAGAANYVNKRNLARRLSETVQDVLAVSDGTRQQKRLHECWNSTNFEFQLDNDTTLIPVLVNHLQQYQASVRRRDETEVVRVGIALHEGLRNAIHHGNLELNSELRQADSVHYYAMAEERLHQSPYCDRRVSLQALESRDESIYVIRDEGPGFDRKRISYDPTSAMNVDKPSGRGLFLIRTFMDEVAFNERGNEITMIHRRHQTNEYPDTLRPLNPPANAMT